MRLRGTTGSALEEVGEDTEGLIEDFSKLNNKIRDLTKTVNNPEGVTIVDKMTGGYKSTYQILLEISKVWKDIGDMQKAELLEIMAGKVRATAAAAILESPEILESAYIDAMQNSAGAGEAAVEASIDSIEKRFNIFKNNMSQAARNLFESNAVKDVLQSLQDFSADLAQNVDKYTPLVNLVKEVLIMATNLINGLPSGGIIGAVFGIKNINGQFGQNLATGLFNKAGWAAPVTEEDVQLFQKYLDLKANDGDWFEAYGQSMSFASRSAQNLAYNLEKEGVSSEVAMIRMQQATRATKEFTIASKALNVALSMIASVLITQAVSALSEWIHAEENARRATMESLQAQKQRREEFEKQQATLDDIIAKYKEYSEQLKAVKGNEEKSAEIRDNLAGLQKTLNEQYGETAKQLDLVNGQYERELQLMKLIGKQNAEEYLRNEFGAYEANKRTVANQNKLFANYDLIQGFYKELSHTGDMAKFNMMIDKTGYHVNADNLDASQFYDAIQNIITYYSERQDDEYYNIFEQFLEYWGKNYQRDDIDLALVKNAEKAMQNYEEVAVLASDYADIYLKNKEALLKKESLKASEEYSEAFKIGITMPDLTNESEAIQSIFKYQEDELIRITAEIAKQQAKYSEDAVNAILNYNPAPSSFDGVDEMLSKKFAVTTQREYKILEAAITEAKNNGIKSYDELFDIYQRRLNEAVEASKDAAPKLLSISNWYKEDSSLAKDKDGNYINKDLINAYESAINGFKDYVEQDAEGKVTINFGKMTRFIADNELFEQLGMESFDHYINGFEENNEFLKELGVEEAKQYVEGFGETSDAFGKYMRDVFKKILSQIDMTTLTDDGRKLLEDALYNINAEVFGVSESVMKIEESYWELKDLQKLVADGVALEKDQATAYMDKYNLYGAVAEVIEEVDEATGKLVKKYKFEQSSIDSLVNEYASLSNEAITSMKDQNKYADDTIKYLRQMQYELIQTALDAAMLRSGLASVNLMDLFLSGSNEGNTARAIDEALRGLSDKERKEINDLMNKASKRLYELKQGYNLDLKDTSDDDGGGSGSGKDDKDNKSQFDWLDSYLDKRARAIDKLTSAYDRLNLKTIESGDVEETYYKKLNKNLRKQNDAIQDEIDALEVAKKEYTDRLSEGLLYKNATDAFGSEAEANKVIKQIKKQYKDEGRYDLTEYTSDQQSALQALMDVYVKFLDAENKIAEDEAKIAENNLKQFQNNIDEIIQAYDHILKEFEMRETQLNHYQTMLTNQGMMENQQYYLAMLDNESRKLETNMEKRDDLLTQLNELEATNKAGTDKWWETKEAIDECTKAMWESEEAAASLDMSMTKLGWDLDDRIMDIKRGVTDETNFLIDTLSALDTDMYQYTREFLGNDAEKTKIFNGQMSEAGLSTLALRRTNLQAWDELIRDYNTLVDNAEKDYLSNTAKVEKLDRLNTLRKERNDMIKSLNDERQAIVDLVKEGYDKQLQSLDALSSKYMDILNSQKAIYDYQKNVEKQTKNISNLRKQMTAYANATDEESKMRLQQLTVQLEEAEGERGNTEYEHRLQDQQQILDQLYQSLEDYFNDKLEDPTSLISDTKDLVNDNLPEIKNYLQQILAEYHQEVPETIANTLGADNVTGNISISDGDITAITSSVNNATTNLENYLAQNDISLADKKLIRDRIDELSDAESSNGVLKANFKRFNKMMEEIDQAILQIDLGNIAERAVLPVIDAIDKTTSAITALQNAGSLLASSMASVSQDFVNLMLSPKQTMQDVASTAFNAATNTFNNTMSPTIVLPNVVNANDFISTLQKNKQFESMVQDMTIGLMSGTNSLTKLKYKF